MGSNKLVFFFCFLFLSSVKGILVELIEPSNPSFISQTLTIYIGEESVPIDNYRSLVSLLQKKLDNVGQSMWASLCSDVSSNEEAVECLEESLNQAENLGYSSGKDNVVVIAHGEGSSYVQSFVSQQNYGALVQMGAYLKSLTPESRGKDLLSFPKPILTLSGELDPFARPNRISFEYQSFLEYAKKVGTEVSLTEKAVIILPGVNHVQFANGFVNPKSRGVDNISDWPNQDAMGEISRVIFNFIAINFLPNNSSESMDEMITDNKRTETIISPFYMLNELDKCAYCLRAQDHIFNFSPQNADRVTLSCNYHSNLVEFSGNPTGLERIGDKASVLTQNLNYYPDNFRDELISQTIAPTQMNCKLKNQESITNLLNFTETNPEPDCLSMNDITIRLVESSLPSTTLNRYRSKGTQLRLIEDIQRRIGPGWLPSRLYFEPSTEVINSVDVASVALITSINSPGPEYWGGNHYCILLPPSFTAEWIMTDSLPKIK